MKKVVLLVFLSIFFVLPIFVSAETWVASSGPYLINGNVIVAQGDTLNIEEGVEVRMQNGSKFDVYGTLNILGTENRKVRITSQEDDGSENPLPGQGGRWSGIVFNEGSKGDINYLDAKYSGYFTGYPSGPIIYNVGGEVSIKSSKLYKTFGNAVSLKSGTTTIENTLIDENASGVIFEGGDFSLIGSTISKSKSYGFISYNNTPSKFFARNNIFSNNTYNTDLNINVNFDIASTTFVGGDFGAWSISGNLVGAKILYPIDDKPIVSGGIMVGAGNKLTIKPGVFLKGGYLISRGGSIDLEGTKEKPIIFTSIADDLVGGDTNNDGGNTNGYSVKTGGIVVENGGVVNVANTSLKYAYGNQNIGPYNPAIGSLVNMGGVLNVADTQLEEVSGAGLHHYSGTTTIESLFIKNGSYESAVVYDFGELNIHNSAFLGDASYYSIWNRKNVDTPDVRNNFWGTTLGPYHATQNASGTSAMIGGDVLFKPFLTENLLVPKRIDPVIIIPGIAGTELYNGNDLIGLDLLQMFTDINDQFLIDSLTLDINGNSQLPTILPKNIVEEITFTIPIINKEIKIADYFRSLIVDLENSGYKEDQSYFVFPYDWRLDLNETKDLLKQKIEEVKIQTGAQKVDIVAHSMGGLLVKDYLNSYGKENVNKLVFVGTPHLGAPKTGKILLEGDRFSIPWLEEDRIKEIAKNSPALHELLPNQAYFDQFQGYFRKYSPLGNSPLLNYTETKNFFLNDKNENPVMFQKAESFYNQNLDTFDFSGITTYNITGCKTPTQAAYGFGIFGEIGQTGYTSGDGTVPMVSSDYINIPSLNKFYVKDGSHAELPSTSGVRDLILGILNSNTNNLAENVSNDPSFCNFKGKKLTWHSPVEIHIYDKNGNHTGPIENNAIEYGVPGIDYDIMGHNKFIFLPTDNSQEYLVEAKGLEKGSFDLSISETDNGQYLITQVFNDVPVTTTTLASFMVNNVANSSLDLKDGGVIKEVPVDAVLNGEAILDLTSPETTVKADWIKDKNPKNNKKMQITLKANDDQSGILETAYSLDEGDTFNIYTKPIIIEKKTDEILFYSIDKAGNNEEVKTFDLEKNKSNKCKNWKCEDINKKHDKIKHIYKKIKGHEQEIIKKFKNLRHKQYE